MNDDIDRWRAFVNKKMNMRDTKNGGGEPSVAEELPAL